MKNMNKHFEQLYIDAINKWVIMNNISSNKTEIYHEAAIQYISILESGNAPFEINSEKTDYIYLFKNMPIKNENNYLDFFIFLDRMYLFKGQIIEMDDLVTKYLLGSPEEKIFDEFDLPYKLLFIRVLVLFENMIETYTKCFKGKYSKSHMSLEDIRSLEIETWVTRERIFEFLNLVRKLIIHSDDCNIRSSNNTKNWTLMLDDFQISMKKELMIYYSIYDKTDSSRNGGRGAKFNLDEIFNVINEIVSGPESWLEVFAILEK